MRETESKILSTQVFNLAAGTSSSETIQTDGSFEFRIDDIVANVTSPDLLISIKYNSDKTLVEGTYINNVCNIAGNGGPLKKISSIQIKSNSSIIVEVKNESAAANKVQISFIGKKLIK